MSALMWIQILLPNFNLHIGGNLEKCPIYLKLFNCASKKSRQENINRYIVRSTLNLNYFGKKLN